MTADAVGTNAFSAAVQWLDELLLGSLAQTVAIIAVAFIGFLMLSGRVDVRRALQVIFGCFLLFGASSIASGIMKTRYATTDPSAVDAARLVAPPVPAAVAAAPYDPYAGAAMPSRQ